MLVFYEFEFLRLDFQPIGQRGPFRYLGKQLRAVGVTILEVKLRRHKSRIQVHVDGFLSRERRQRGQSRLLEVSLAFQNFFAAEMVSAAGYCGAWPVLDAQMA